MYKFDTPVYEIQYDTPKMQNYVLGSLFFEIRAGTLRIIYIALSILETLYPRTL